MSRIDQLEARLGDSPVAPAARAPREQRLGRSPRGVRSRPPAAREPARVSAGGGAAVAVATAQAEPEPEAVAEPAVEMDLERIKGLWAAVAEAVREQNGMVGALIAGSVPCELEGDRLTVAFPEEAAFLKKKAEANRELVLDALAQPHRSRLRRGLRAAQASEEPRPGPSARRIWSRG